MAGYLTTHVLDTARGCPAAGLKIELYKIVSNSSEFLSEAVTCLLYTSDAADE